MSREIVFTREQAMLADIADRFFRERWPIESVRAAMESAVGFDREVWGEMAELGWTGIAVPEEHGGAGLGAVELASLAEIGGRRLFASPFVSTQLVITALLGAGGGAAAEAARREWLPQLAQGAIGAVALFEPGGRWDLDAPACRAEVSGSQVTLSGRKSFVLDWELADLVAVSVDAGDGPALALVEPAGFARDAVVPEVVIDETRRSRSLVLDGAVVEPVLWLVGDAARAALGAVRDLALLLVSAEACGGLAGTLDLVVGYLRSRRQFGRLIGSYQALKHPTVDILLGLERSRSLLYGAATAFGGEGSETLLRMAKAHACEVFAWAGDRAIQFHGAFGFTWECDAQLFLRRALWCQTWFGDPLHHRRRLESELLG